MKKNEIKKFFISPLGKGLVILIGMIVIYGLIVLGFSTSSTVISGITILACAVFGWRGLNKITPNVFLVMSVGGWAIYFLVKGLLSIFIGAFIAPFVIGRSIANAIAEDLKAEEEDAA